MTIARSEFSTADPQGGEFGEVNIFRANPNFPSPPENPTLVEERLLRKQELAAAFRLFGRFGFSEGLAGHITARDPESPDHFWINPLGMSFNLIKTSDLLPVDHTGEVVEGDGAVNFAWFYIHSELHAARPDAIAAAHAHPLYGEALASLDVELLPITQDACAFYNDHVVYDFYGGPAGYREEGERIAAALGENKAAILRNHGLITVGHSVGEAALWFITMERSCQAQLAAMAAGKPILIDPEIAEFTRRETGSHYARWFSFRPLWDQITKEQPDLFD
ncbi:class II aldolase/adducin family protein [Nocardia sp. 2YAB30]|uniref:class II aldolase/adducin family protein n=1 Tax=Nocardia sp. 2YAB30 TaxID=3233022 RepID=UPI003F9609BC